MRAGVLALAFALLAPLTPAEVDVSESIERYPVRGSKARHLRRDMKKNGPRRGGKRYDAYTEWKVTWQFGLDRRNGSCSVAAPEVRVEVTTTLPEWHRGDDAEAKLEERWERYMAGLIDHENGHKRFGLEAAAAIDRRLVGLGRFPDCDGLERAVESATDEIIDRYRRREREYDDETRHGAAEGARLRAGAGPG